MLSILASHPIRPEVEAVDQDPGIVSLLSAITRSVRRGAASAGTRVRSAHQAANEAELYSSSSAWPYNHRSR